MNPNIFLSTLDIPAIFNLYKKQVLLAMLCLYTKLSRHAMITHVAESTCYDSVLKYKSIMQQGDTVQH